MRLSCACLLLAACSFSHGVASGDDNRDDGGIDGMPDTPPDAWWDAAWSIRMPLTITNNSMTEELAVGYQVGFPFAVSPTCTGRDDVRIVVHHATQLDRVIDDKGSTFWFKLQTAIAPGTSSTGEYFIYCGNPAPGSAPNTAKLVFDFYEGFSSALDANVWTASASGATVTGGKLVLGNGTGNDHGVITKTQLVTANHAVDFDAATSSAMGNSFWGGFENSTAYTPPWLIWWTNATTIIAPAFQAISSSQDWRGTSKTLDTQSHLYSIEYFATHASFRLDNAVYEAHTYDAAPPATWSIRLWSLNNTPTVSFEMVRVRQAIDPAPTVTIGTVEQKP